MRRRTPAGKESLLQAGLAGKEGLPTRTGHCRTERRAWRPRSGAEIRREPGTWATTISLIPSQVRPQATDYLHGKRLWPPAGDRRAPDLAAGCPRTSTAQASTMDAARLCTSRSGGPAVMFGVSPKPASYFADNIWRSGKRRDNPHFMVAPPGSEEVRRRNAWAGRDEPSGRTLREGNRPSEAPLFAGDLSTQ